MGISSSVGVIGILCPLDGGSVASSQVLDHEVHHLARLVGVTHVLDQVELESAENVGLFAAMSV
jgi:hypothetical protein